MVKITVRKSGAFRVEAVARAVELVDADGKSHDLAGKISFSLCRCGGSFPIPFGHGAHKRVASQAVETAVKAEEQKNP